MPIPQPNNIKVIGSGFSRSGTVSTRKMLLQLGLTPCYHGFELMNAQFFDDLNISGHSDMGRIKDWARAAKLKHEGRTEECCQVLDSLLEKYVASVDWPASHFWQEQLLMNPDAIVLHNIRDSSDAWADSFMNTIAELYFGQEDDFTREIGIYIIPGLDDPKYRNDPEAQRKLVKERYEAYDREVREKVPENQLFVFNIKQGWGPVEWRTKVGRVVDETLIPTSDEKGPHANDRSEFMARTKAITENFPKMKF